MREALLRAPMACTEQGPYSENVLKTERSDVLVCPGLMQWGVAEGFQLDVIRYGTIVEFRVDEFSYVRVQRYPRRSQLFPKIHIVRVKGEITAVLKGSAPVGVVEFPITTFAGQWGFYRFNSHREIRVGGWAFLKDWYGPEPIVGLVFLPTGHISDGIFLGCAEGHFVPTIPEAGEAYLHDVRRITRHLREKDAELLAHQPADSAMVRSLAAGGGRMMGYYLAERCAWRVALSLLQEPTGPGPISSLQLGLLEGLMRMRALLRAGFFPADAWGDADDHEIERRLARWAIFALAGGVGEGADLEASMVQQFPIFSAAMYTLNDATWSFPVAELGLPAESLNAAAKRFEASNRHGTLEDWLRGKGPEPHETYRVDLFADRDFGACGSPGAHSASRRLQADIAFNRY